MFWFTLAKQVTHTSVSQTKQLIGQSEYWDWRAYYEIVAKAEKDAQEKANRR